MKTLLICICILILLAIGVAIFALSLCAIVKKSDKEVAEIFRKQTEITKDMEL